MTEQTHKQELTITVDVPKGYKAVDFRKARVGELYISSLGGQVEVYRAGQLGFERVILKRDITLIPDEWYMCRHKDGDDTPLLYVGDNLWKISTLDDDCDELEEGGFPLYRMVKADD